MITCHHIPFTCAWSGLLHVDSTLGYWEILMVGWTLILFGYQVCSPSVITNWKEGTYQETVFVFVFLTPRKDNNSMMTYLPSQDNRISNLSQNSSEMYKQKASVYTTDVIQEQYLLVEMTRHNIRSTCLMKSTSCQEGPSGSLWCWDLGQLWTQSPKCSKRFQCIYDWKANKPTSSHVIEALSEILESLW